MNEVLVIGSSSMIGSRFIELNGNQFTFATPAEGELNVLDSESIAKVIGKSSSSVVINFAAFTNVGKAEEEKDNEDGLCYKLNAGAVKTLADECKKTGKHLVQISTEYVFNGTKTDGLYNEQDQPSPINWYGRTKYLGERFISESGCKFTIARLTMPYRAKFDGKKDLVRGFLGMLKEGKEIFGCTDVINTPTFIDDIAKGLGLVINKELEGIIHLSSGDEISPFNFACTIAQEFGLDKNLVKPITFEEFSKGRPAPLLKNSGLDNIRFKKEFGEGILHNVNSGLEILKTQMLY